MKTLVALTALLMSLAASGETIKLMEYKFERDVEIYRTMFRVNKSLNRAWVEVTLAESHIDDLHYTDERVKVPGLSYNPEINGVVYNNNGEEIVCGTFYNARWVIDRGMSFKDTGRCVFETNKFTKQVDDGFYIRNVEMVEVLLKIQ